MPKTPTNPEEDSVWIKIGTPLVALLFIAPVVLVFVNIFTADHSEGLGKPEGLRPAGVVYVLPTTETVPHATAA